MRLPYSDFLFPSLFPATCHCLIGSRLSSGPPHPPLHRRTSGKRGYTPFISLRYYLRWTENVVVVDMNVSNQRKLLRCRLAAEAPMEKTGDWLVPLRRQIRKLARGEGNDGELRRRRRHRMDVGHSTLLGELCIFRTPCFKQWIKISNPILPG